MSTRAGQTSAASRPPKNADWDPLSVRQALLGLVAPPPGDDDVEATREPSPALLPASRRPAPESTGLVDVRAMAALLRRTPPRLALLQPAPSPGAPAPAPRPEPAAPAPGPGTAAPTSARLAFALGALSGALTLALAWLALA